MRKIPGYYADGTGVLYGKCHDGTEVLRRKCFVSTAILCWKCRGRRGFECRFLTCPP